jgi:tetratricopeptide (TPR) repeat protein
MTGQGIKCPGIKLFAELVMDVLFEPTSAPARKLTRADLANLSKPALKALLHERLTPGSSLELARALHRLGATAAAAKALRTHPLDHYKPAHWPFIGAITTARGSDAQTDALLERYFADLPPQGITDAKARMLVRWIIRSGHPRTLKLQWMWRVASARMIARWLLGAARRRMVRARLLTDRDTTEKRIEGTVSKPPNQLRTKLPRKLTRKELEGLNKSELNNLLHQQLTLDSLIEIARALNRLGEPAAAAHALHMRQLDLYHPTQWPFIGAVTSVLGPNSETDALLLRYWQSTPPQQITTTQGKWLARWVNKSGHPLQVKARWMQALQTADVLNLTKDEKWVPGLLAFNVQELDGLTEADVRDVASAPMAPKTRLQLANHLSKINLPNLAAQTLLKASIDDYPGNSRPDIGKLLLDAGSEFVLDVASHKAEVSTSAQLDLLSLMLDAATQPIEYQSILNIIVIYLPQKKLQGTDVYRVNRLRICCALALDRYELAKSLILQCQSLSSDHAFTAAMLLDFIDGSDIVNTEKSNWPEDLPIDLLEFLPPLRRSEFLYWLYKLGVITSRKETLWLRQQWSKMCDENNFEILNIAIANDNLDLLALLTSLLSDETLNQIMKRKQFVNVFRVAIQNWKLRGGEKLFDEIQARVAPSMGALLNGAEIKGLLGKQAEARTTLASVGALERMQLGVIRVYNKLNDTEALKMISAHIELRAAESINHQDSKVLGQLITSLIELNRVEVADRWLAKFIEGRASQSPMESSCPESEVLTLYRLFARTRELLDDFEGAIRAYSQYSHLGSQDTHYFTGMARCLFMQGHHDQAMELINKLPSRATDEGKKCFNHIAYHILLNLGELESAFEGYRHRPIADDLRSIVGSHVYSYSDVELPSAHKNQLLLTEFGPGDELRFASLYNELALTSNSTTVTCDPRLEAIFNYSFPAIDFFPVNRWRRNLTNELKIDDYSKRDRVGSVTLATSMDNQVIDILPNFERVSFVLDNLTTYRKTRDSFHRRPYLKVTPEIQNFWNRRISERAQGRIVVGLSWRSMLLSTSRSIFYTGIEDWKTLFARPDVMVVSLQTGAKSDEIALANSAGGIEVFDDLDLKDDFMSAAALMLACDIVYAPATTALELAGAVGANAVLLSMNEYTRWRLQPDGRDIWHGSVTVRQRPAKQRASDFVSDLCRELNHRTLSRLKMPLDELRTRSE